MKSKRSRLTLMGVVALALCVTVGFASGTVASAAKKQKKKAGATVAKVSNTTPRAIPDRPAGVSSVSGRLDTTLKVGKKFKGKTVGTLELTFQTTGDAATSSNDLEVDITAPNGYRLPGNWWDNSIGNSQSVGPLTITPNSPVRTCTATTPPCSNPFSTLNRPFVGTVGDNTFMWLRGLPMKGKWIVTVLDRSNTNTSILNSVALKITAG